MHQGLSTEPLLLLEPCIICLLLFLPSLLNTLLEFSTGALVLLILCLSGSLIVLSGLLLGLEIFLMLLVILLLLLLISLLLGFVVLSLSLLILGLLLLHVLLMSVKRPGIHSVGLLLLLSVGLCGLLPCLLLGLVVLLPGLLVLCLDLLDLRLVLLLGLLEGFVLLLHALLLLRLGLLNGLLLSSHCLLVGLSLLLCNSGSVVGELFGPDHHSALPGLHGDAPCGGDPVGCVALLHVGVADGARLSHVGLHHGGVQSHQDGHQLGFQVLEGDRVILLGVQRGVNGRDSLKESGLGSIELLKIGLDLVLGKLCSHLAMWIEGTEVSLGWCPLGKP
mmetsp:Transcript_2718/g.5611  ORF Transcript_2718/g.5611 Transcript_2718/m.5611 type:complete len:334 (+) Transcript_2718:1796-2797(+)